LQISNLYNKWFPFSCTSAVFQNLNMTLNFGPSTIINLKCSFGLSAVWHSALTCINFTVYKKCNICCNKN